MAEGGKNEGENVVQGPDHFWAGGRRNSGEPLRCIFHQLQGEGRAKGGG